MLLQTYQRRHSCDNLTFTLAKCRSNNSWCYQTTIRTERCVNPLTLEFCLRAILISLTLHSTTNQRELRHIIVRSVVTIDVCSTAKCVNSAKCVKSTLNVSISRSAKCVKSRSAKCVKHPNAKCVKSDEFC